MCVTVSDILTLLHFTNRSLLAIIIIIQKSSSFSAETTTTHISGCSVLPLLRFIRVGSATIGLSGEKTLTRVEYHQHCLGDSESGVDETALFFQEPCVR